MDDTAVARGDRAVLVLPTFNEIENLNTFIRKVRASAPLMHILIVDDNSPDGTGALADRLATELGNMHVLHRSNERGLGSANAAASFSWAINAAAATHSTSTAALNAAPTTNSSSTANTAASFCWAFNAAAAAINSSSTANAGASRCWALNAAATATNYSSTADAGASRCWAINAAAAAATATNSSSTANAAASRC